MALVIACLSVLMGLAIAPADGFLFGVMALVSVGLILSAAWILRGLKPPASDAPGGGAPGRSTISRLAHGCSWAAIVLLFLVYPLFSGTLQSQRLERIQCSLQLHKIGLALRSYHDRYGRFPPAYVVDTSGQPMHSWRVLLLPFLEREDLYKQLRLDEPWNSPHNRAVLDGDRQARTLFSCPCDPDGGDTPAQASYSMIVGRGTISDGKTAVRLQDMKDGGHETILLAESTRSRIHWAEPRDLPFAEMSFRVNDREYPAIRSCHAGGAHILLADGTVQFLSNRMDPKIVKGMATVAGGRGIGVRL
jgi:hypothetical protein